MYARATAYLINLLKNSGQATGTLGSHILKALVGGGYTVTAVQRKESTKSAPSGVASVKVDLTNKGELVSAFKGQDAVIRSV